LGGRRLFDAAAAALARRVKTDFKVPFCRGGATHTVLPPRVPPPPTGLFIACAPVAGQYRIIVCVAAAEADMFSATDHPLVRR